MEPVTHLLTGAVLARTGFTRRTSDALLGMIIAAEFPDVDVLWSLGGPVVGFEHHRGITHTFLGVPLQAAILLLVFYLLDKRRRRSRGTLESQTSRARTASRIPFHAGWFYAGLCLALLSHVLLDWTNDYGVRPFFPLSNHWYAGSLLFIFDPLVFLLLLGALTLPSFFKLIRAEVGDMAPSRGAETWAFAALLSVACVLLLRAVGHSHAVDLAHIESTTVPSSGSSSTGTQALSPVAVLASPDPINPFIWHRAIDFGPAIRLEDINVWQGLTTQQSDLLYKAAPSPALKAAEASFLGRVYLSWSPMPLLSTSEGAVTNADPALSAEPTVVIFRDPRFMGNLPFLSHDGAPSMTGTVELNAKGQVLAQTLDGREQPTR